jgi:hypothetical protein
MRNKNLIVRKINNILLMNQTQTQTEQLPPIIHKIEQNPLSSLHKQGEAFCKKEDAVWDNE